MNIMKKIAAGLMGFIASASAWATSYVDFSGAGYTTVATNLQDTALDGVDFILPVVLSVGALFVAVKLVKRVLGKVG